MLLPPIAWTSGYRESSEKILGDEATCSSISMLSLDVRVLTVV